MDAINPLLNKYNYLPAFSAIEAGHIRPAIEVAIEQYWKKLNALLAENEEYTWLNFIEPLMTLDDQLNKVLHPINHLTNVVNDNELKEAYNEALPTISEFGNDVGQHVALREAIMSIVDGPAYDNMSGEQKAVLQTYVDGYRLNGALLNAKAQKEFNDISRELSLASNQFAMNSTNDTSSRSIHVSVDDLKGVPQYAIDEMVQDAEKEGLEGALVNFRAPCVAAIMNYAHNRGLRESVYVTSAAIAKSDPKYDNTELTNKIVQLKHRKAQLLGFGSYAAMSVHKKMVESPFQVFDFLYDLHDACKEAAQDEYYELQQFAEQRGCEDLEPWDIGYYVTLMEQLKFSFDENEVRKYLPADKVLDAMFNVATSLYGITFKEVNAKCAPASFSSRGVMENVDVWHDTVRFFHVYDEDDAIIASFYLDMYAREGKRGGAWADAMINRRADELGTVRNPVAILVCNFNAPGKNTPSLLNMDEVETLFHEFGHGLHIMLTEVKYPDIAGYNNVPWDAVELPSQFMENFCWDRNTLLEMTNHYETGAQMPKTLLDKVLRARNFRSASVLCRQVLFSLFDMHLYNDYLEGDAGDNYVQETYEEVYDNIAVTPRYPLDSFPNRFGHIFSGGYAAGYFSYKWAEVLSSDAFDVFENCSSIYNREVGRRFRETILASGGSRDFMELFEEFRGRKPDSAAMMRHLGLNS